MAGLKGRSRVSDRSPYQTYDEGRKGENLSAILTQRYLTARRISAFMHYLHLDVAMTGVVLAMVLAGGLGRHFNALAVIDAALPTLSLAGVGRVQLQTTEPGTKSLPQPLKAALDNVVQRYRVSPDALHPVFEAVQEVAHERNLDPLLLIAIISIESRFNPFSQSPMGAQGLMQIIPRYHLGKGRTGAGEQPFLDPVVNVRIGAQIVQEAIRRQGGLVEGLQYYAGAIDDEEKTYANKVLAEKSRLEQAARRKDGSNS